MNHTDFHKLVEQIQDQTFTLLVAKGAEYAGSEDRLANFRRGAALTGTDPLTVLFIYMSKHYDAFSRYVREKQAGMQPELSEPITGRLADLINYAILAWALIEDQPGESVEKLSPATSQEPFSVDIADAYGKVTTLHGEEAMDFLRQTKSSAWARGVNKWKLSAATIWNFV